MSGFVSDSNDVVKGFIAANENYLTQVDEVSCNKRCDPINRSVATNSIIPITGGTNSTASGSTEG